MCNICFSANETNNKRTGNTRPTTKKMIERLSISLAVRVFYLEQHEQTLLSVFSISRTENERGPSPYAHTATAKCGTIIIYYRCSIFRNVCRYIQLICTIMLYITYDQHIRPTKRMSEIFGFFFWLAHTNDANICTNIGRKMFSVSFSHHHITFRG